MGNTILGDGGWSIASRNHRTSYCITGYVQAYYYGKLVTDEQFKALTTAMNAL
jgi:hypothetical protein